MKICRTENVNGLSRSFIKAKPLAVIKWVVLAIVLVAVIVIITVTVGSSSMEFVGWIDLLIMVGFIILMATSVARSEKTFNAFVMLDNGEIIYINLGNVFMNNSLFGEETIFSHSKIRMIAAWFKTAKRMKDYSDADKLDAFITKKDVLICTHFIQKVFSVKSNDKYIFAKLRLKKCQSIKGELFTEFTKKVRIPKNFENADSLENELRAAAEK